MNSDPLEELAAAYAAGALDPLEAKAFTRMMKNNPRIQQTTDELNEVIAQVFEACSTSGSLRPSPDLKQRILHRIEFPIEQRKAEVVLSALAGGEKAGVVVSDSRGLVEWVNPAFSELCGYSLDEVRGRKLGPMLQGEFTNRETVAKMSAALHAAGGFSEEVLNYHKNGTPYWVSITVSPIFDSDRRLRSYVALERILPERPVPVLA
jgi:PAS domain S-box-containing protein